jgi:hypothetical protein
MPKVLFPLVGKHLRTLCYHARNSHASWKLLWLVADADADYVS